MGKDKQKTQSVLENVFMSALDKLAAEAGRMATRLLVQLDMKTGEICVYDEREVLIGKNIIFEWTERGEKRANPSANPYALIRAALGALRSRKMLDKPFIMLPFEIVHVDDGLNEIATIYTLDDPNVASEGRLMKNLEQELQIFFKKLFVE